MDIKEKGSFIHEDINEMKKIEVPRATAKCLVIYHRYLRFARCRKRRISTECQSEAKSIAQQFVVTSPFRKLVDNRYDVEYLLEFFSPYF